MANLIIRPNWYLPDRSVTPEAIYSNRRRFIKQLGLVGACSLSASTIGVTAEPPKAVAKGFPFPRNPSHNPGWRLTLEDVVTSYNNFYEFSLDKDQVRHLTGKFVVSPWSIEVSGLCEKPGILDLDQLLSGLAVEERVYRFRCVEAWAMIVPWTGFPLAELIKKLKPKAEAKFVRFETAHRPAEFPGVTSPRTAGYPWPYFDGLTMEEAMNPLTFMATGLYGKPMPKQNGAPVRLVVPWKYGFKSIKSVAKIEFIDKQPKTFWETLSPEEYPFESNVDPKVPHPRWSQATERMIDTGDRVRTQLYNGYAAQVADLYPKKS